MTERCKRNPCCADYLNCKVPPQFLPRESYDAYKRRTGGVSKEQPARQGQGAVMTEDLRKAAEAARDAQKALSEAPHFRSVTNARDAHHAAMDAFRALANPAAILALYAERDEAQQRAEDYRGMEAERRKRQRAAEASLASYKEEVERLRKQITSASLDALAADGQAHESYAAAMALHGRLTAILDWCDLAADQPDTFNHQGVKLLQGPVFDDARKAVADHAIYAPKEPPHAE